MFDLNTLTQAIGRLDEDAVLSMLRAFAAEGQTGQTANDALLACQKGMGIVGDLFEKGEYYIGDLIFSGNLLSTAADILRPLLGGIGNAVGKIVVGTVHGDLHNIGKNIFIGMAEAAGFEVYDLGIDVPVGAFVEKVREVKPDIVGLSGVLTMAINSMKDTVDGLRGAGLTDKAKIIIGGACASGEAMAVTGADAWSANAAEAIDICLGWTGARA